MNKIKFLYKGSSRRRAAFFCPNLCVSWHHRYSLSAVADHSLVPHTNVDFLLCFSLKYRSIISVAINWLRRYLFVRQESIYQ